jgi:uncharacterized membrane protein
METFFIISGVTLWSLIILVILYFLYDDIKYRIRMHKHLKAFQELDKQEKEIMSKLKEK